MEVIKLLLIDDNPGDVRLIEHTLNAQPRIRFSVDATERLGGGVQKLKGEQYNIVLLDLSLPDSQGLETFTKLKAQARDLPIIVLTGLNDEGIAIQAVRKGAQDYIVKDEMNTGLLVRSISYAIERSSAEEKRRWLEMKMLYAQKLESLSVLSGGVAHNFSSMLTAVIGNAELALGKLSEDSLAYANIKKIESSALQAVELTNQMLAYAGKGRFIVEALNISKLTEDMKAIIQTTVPPKIKLEYELTQNLPLIKADVPQIQQMLLNLINNAAEAIGENRGSIRIRAFGVRADTRWLHDSLFTGEISPGAYTCLQISDNGIGISPETKAKIFDPFFTTKFTSRGLGLAAVQGIVRGHKGAIRITSQVNRGTKIVILLPSIKEKPSTFIPNSKPVKASIDTSVLLIESEPSLAEVAQTKLEQAGYRVFHAQDRIQAVDILKRQQQEIKLIVLDVPEPTVGIRSTLSQLRQFNSSLLILLTCDYDLKDVPIDIENVDVNAIIKKPYRFNLLIEKVQELLNTEIT
ncbi:MAG: response regulator [Fibrobacteria bacterium]|nr:response regulator [Fibrobacteria bacterium]